MAALAKRWPTTGQVQGLAGRETQQRRTEQGHARRPYPPPGTTGSALAGRRPGTWTAEQTVWEIEPRSKSALVALAAAVVLHGGLAAGFAALPPATRPPAAVVPLTLVDLTGSAVSPTLPAPGTDTPPPPPSDPTPALPQEPPAPPHLPAQTQPVAPEPPPVAETPPPQAKPPPERTVAARPRPPRAPEARKTKPDGPPTRPESSPGSGERTASTVASAGGASLDEPAADTSFTPPDTRAAYLKNPSPPYPESARRRGVEGLVVLEVRVSAAGAPDSVQVSRSSGHDLLDRAAADAVRRWRFTAARRAGVAVAATVEVPIRFSLRSN